MTEINEFGQTVGAHLPNWKPAIFPSKTEVLTGQYCFLEPLDIEKHAQKLFDALWVDTKGESWTYLPYGPFLDFVEYRNWLQNSILPMKDGTSYVIIDKKTSLPVGMTSYLRINPDHGSIECGNLHYSSLLQKSAASTEAMYLMMK